MAIPQRRTCGACRAEPAICQIAGSDTWLCAKCGLYRSGIEHGRALGGLDVLVHAISELRGSLLDAQRILKLCSDAVHHQVDQMDLIPPRAPVDDPRPFAALLTSSTPDHADG